MGKIRKFVGQFTWPFFRYDVLMPEQVKTDLFEWLYLSLVVQQNEQRQMARNSYEDTVKYDVRRVLKEKFSSLLDDATIDNIIATTEKEFVLEKEGRAFSGKYLKDDTFPFLDTYEDLFSSQVTVQRVYQDAICGAVVPCFSDEQPKEERNVEFSLQPAKNLGKPTQTQIANAYKLYNKLNSLGVKQEEIIEEEEYEVDPDAEVDFQPQFPEEGSFEQVSQLDNRKFSAHFIENSRCRFDLAIGVYADDTRLYIDTPFNVNTTEAWLNKQLKKARSLCAELDSYLTELETAHVSLKTAEELGQTADAYVYSKGVADQLSKCGDIYRMIEYLPEDFKDLKKLLIVIDKHFVSKYDDYFNKVGKYLECLIRPFIDHSDKEDRQYFDYQQYCDEITYICNQRGVNARPLMSENIFGNWQKAWDHFKADVANLFISNTKMRSNTKLYPSFIQDIFKLYDTRSDGSHYKPNVTLQYNESDIEKLYNVTRVIVELI